MATTAKAKPAPKAAPATTGAVIDQLWTLRESKRAAEEEVKKFEGIIKEIEESLMTRLDAEGLDKATGRKASISISTSVVADVQDWEAFHTFIGKKKFFHLLQRRVSEPAYRELLDQGAKVPGVLPLSRKKLNLRSLST